VCVGVIEEITFDTPGFVKDLPPFSARIDVGGHVGEVERFAAASVAGLEFVGADDGE
jgi:hypothetical protein